MLRLARAPLASLAPRSSLAPLSSLAPPTRPPAARGAIALYAGTLAGLALLAADEYLDLRQWTTRRHSILSPQRFDVTIRSRVRAAPSELGQGCVDWPAGRVLLQWALDGGVPLSGAALLEIGSGVGLAALGFAIAAARPGGTPPPSSVVATDSCAAALDNLQRNARANGVALDGSAPLRVERWDAAAGAAGVRLLGEAVEIGSLTHVIGADLVSLPLFEGAALANPVSDEADGADAALAGRGGLEETLAALLAARPGLQVTLLLVDRCAGGALNALADAAGVEPRATAPRSRRDPALAAFEKRCASLGLEARRVPLPAHVVEHVHASQSWPTRAYWWLADVWEGLALYSIAPKEAGATRA
ncbi:hypothetical protein AB1Y20_011415 [Prymnesium parvum]|uniref:Calmodulin-lysine N-methyltransferase n=1 Tax=Prymnesium parvum TaxID=97485 RepID=A0AB34IQH9_PRYPA